jgi:D-3-phosphoglycerate dehydrogenase
MVKILVADPISESGLDVFKNHNGHFQVEVKTKMAAAALKEAVADVDAIIVRSETQITAEILAAAKKVKIVGRAGVGIDNIDVNAASRQGVIVVNVPGGNTISAAEHTMALLLALSRNVPQANASVKAGEWKRSQFVGTELQGKVLGLIGLGRIGREVAKRCQSFGMSILGYDPFASEEYAKTFNITTATLEKIYAEADYITVHVPLNDSTRNLFNAATFKKLKPGVRLINCARGGIINEKDLAEALKSGLVKGAALDVFEQEPIAKDNPLIGLPNIILTPHLGASTEEAQVKVAQELAETFKDFFLAGSVRNAVNLPAMDAEQYKDLEPYILLSEKLGKLASQLFSGAATSLKMTFAGELSQKNTTPLGLAILKGFLSPMLDIEVNLVNAPHLAKERNLKWTETKTSQTADFTSLVSIQVSANGKSLSVSGTVLGKRSLRIVAIDELTVDVEPEGSMVVYTNVDKPGVIGHVGTVLGKNKINIAAMQVGRKATGGEAVTVVTVDSPVPAEVLSQIREFPGITKVTAVYL